VRAPMPCGFVVVVWLLLAEICGQHVTTGNRGRPRVYDTRRSAQSNLVETQIYVTNLANIDQKVRATRRQVGPEVGPTPAFYRCIPTGIYGPTCIFWANLIPFLAEGRHVRARGLHPPLVVRRGPPPPRGAARWPIARLALSWDVGTCPY
jgi:hypothetical protein